MNGKKIRVYIYNWGVLKKSLIWNKFDTLPEVESYIEDMRLKSDIIIEGFSGIYNKFRLKYYKENQFVIVDRETNKIIKLI